MSGVTSHTCIPFSAGRASQLALPTDCLQVLLRELSRDVVELLRALVGSTSFPTIPTDRLAAAFGKTSLALGSARRAAVALGENGRGSVGGDGKSGDASSSSLTGHGLGGIGRGGSDKNPSLNSMPWEETVASALLPVRTDKYTNGKVEFGLF